MNATVPIHFLDLRDRIASTREPLSRSKHLPGDFYHSADIHAVEKRKIFLDTWLCVAREEEIPNPGDYLTLRVVDEPVAVVRQPGGEVAAFVNMCLHRGVAVAEGRGNARGFSCPYHAWGYDLGGKLKVAPRMQHSECDMQGSRMPPMQCVTWRGWVFVSFNRAAMPFEEFIAPYEKDDKLWWFQTGRTRLAEKLVIEVACNWKLLVENLVDVYHVPILHKGTFGSMVRYGGTSDSFECDLLPRGGWAYDQKARPHSSGGKQMFPTLPWLEGMSDDTSSRAGIFPNVNLSMRLDSLRNWVVWPTSPTTTELHIYLMFPHAAFDDPEFAKNLEVYKAFLHKLVGEDAGMVASLQLAMKSPFFEPGPMSHLESAVRHVITNYLDVVTAG
ncbi:aromatic ring-hydroxylating oxygenase subunit alpha [Ramlibacter sp.]|uniref:aromatic ring-hydroxylating oxygenase subunit alpha n=1 Tax=Ramlibacter sp. TaxID=1917967 RepID=UPI003D14DF13